MGAERSADFSTHIVFPSPIADPAYHWDEFLKRDASKVLVFGCFSQGLEGKHSRKSRLKIKLHKQTNNNCSLFHAFPWRAFPLTREAAVLLVCCPYSIWLWVPKNPAPCLGPALEKIKIKGNEQREIKPQI